MLTLLSWSLSVISFEFSNLVFVFSFLKWALFDIVFFHAFLRSLVKLSSLKRKIWSHYYKALSSISLKSVYCKLSSWLWRVLNEKLSSNALTEIDKKINAEVRRINLIILIWIFILKHLLLFLSIFNLFYPCFLCAWYKKVWIK
jgi:hypothetical protein